MLYLTFHLGPDRYALAAQRVVEVLPLVELKRIPRTPDGVAGLFNYRGRPVPAIDLTALALGGSSRELASTRIILVQHPDAAGDLRLVGLIAERVTDMIRCDPGDFLHAGVEVRRAPYLGPVKADAQGMIQLIEEQRLLPAPVRDAIFIESEGVSA